MAGAGELEAAVREAGNCERHLTNAGSAGTSQSSGADMLSRIRELRQEIEVEVEARRAEQRRRELEEEARRQRELEDERRRREEEQLEEEQQRRHAQLQEEILRSRRPENSKGATFPAAEASPPSAGDDPEELECPICLAAMAPGPALAALPCGHQFHRLCIAAWGAGCPYRCGEGAAPRAGQPASGRPRAASVRAPEPPAPPQGPSAPPPLHRRPAAAHSRSSGASSSAPASAATPAPPAAARPTRPYLPPSLRGILRPES
eukprot:tig00021332_g20333.t1